jgi:hypothetical protein
LAIKLRASKNPKPKYASIYKKPILPVKFIFDMLTSLQFPIGSSQRSNLSPAALAMASLSFRSAVQRTIPRIVAS